VVNSFPFVSLRLPLFLLSLFTHTPTSAIYTLSLHDALPILVGLSQPQVGPASRSIWSVLLPPGTTRSAAYSYEAISMEVFFILRSEEHTSELQSRENLVCRLLLEKKKKTRASPTASIPSIQS